MSDINFLYGCLTRLQRIVEAGDELEGGNAHPTVGFIVLPVGIFVEARSLPWEFPREERLKQPLKVLHLPVVAQIEPVVGLGIDCRG